MNQNENQVKSKTIVFNLCTISGEYQKENETKKSYHKIGTLFFKDDKFSAILESLPISKNVYAFLKNDCNFSAPLENQVFNLTYIIGKFLDENNQEKNKYLSLGTLFVNKDGKVNIKFDALPLANTDKNVISLYTFPFDKK